MRFSCAKLGCLLPVVFVACLSESEPTAPQLPSTAVLNNGDGVVLHVNGAGAVDLTAAAAGLADFQFVANKKADGTVSGHFRQSRSSAAGTVDFEGVVTCL